MTALRSSNLGKAEVMRMQRLPLQSRVAPMNEAKIQASKVAMKQLHQFIAEIVRPELVTVSLVRIMALEVVRLVGEAQLTQKRENPDAGTS